jgi:SAM-dependent methyltransferase
VKDRLRLIAESYDRGIEYGRRGISLYDDLPEAVTNHPDYIAYKKITESCVPSDCGDSGHREIREFLSPALNMRFIDLGCCLNLMLNGYDKWPSIYYGVDISGETIGLLNEFCVRNNLSVGALVCGSVHETPFDTSFFDIGACIGVLEYYERDFVEKILLEAHRILRPGGKFVLDIPNILSPACRGMMMLEEHAGRPDRFDMPPAGFEKMLRSFFRTEKAEKDKDMPMFKYFLRCIK